MTDGLDRTRLTMVVEVLADADAEEADGVAERLISEGQQEGWSAVLVRAEWVSEACGSWRVVEIEDGLPSRAKWCSRIAGPCPFPGTPEQRGVGGPDGDRKCADSPGRRLSVRYPDSAVVDARRHLRQFQIEEGDALKSLRPGSDTVWVAIAALSACIGSEEDPGAEGEGR